MFGFLSQNNLVDEVASLHRNNNVRSLAESHGLTVNLVTWEDTARNKGSCYGPNISDMTLQLTQSDRNLPVFRKNNFADVTADMEAKTLSLTVGNEVINNQKQELKRISLEEYLTNASKYIAPEVGNLWLKKDEHILTSVQHCFLPVEKDEVSFNVQLFNYQSSETDPAVLVIVGSSQGTSAQTVTSTTEKLFFNNHGEASDYIAERLKIERQRLGKQIEGKMNKDEQERNVLFIYQVPLKQKPKPRYDPFEYIVNESSMSNSFMESSQLDCAQSQSYMQPECALVKCADSKPKSSFMKNLFTTNSSSTNSLPGCVGPKMGIDHVMLKAGKSHSKFQGTRGLKLERDERYPIRLTLQFYQGTDTNNIPETVIQEMGEKITSIYKKGVDMGSLVIEKTSRKTEADILDVSKEERNRRGLFSFLGSD
jgi:hypothetical protein